jgi:hypothetical protein
MPLPNRYCEVESQRAAEAVHCLWQAGFPKVPKLVMSLCQAILLAVKSAYWPDFSRIRLQRTRSHTLE